VVEPPRRPVSPKLPNILEGCTAAVTPCLAFQFLTSWPFAGRAEPRGQSPGPGEAHPAAGAAAAAAANGRQSSSLGVVGLTCRRSRCQKALLAALPAGPALTLHWAAIPSSTSPDWAVASLEAVSDLRSTAWTPPLRRRPALCWAALPQQPSGLVAWLTPQPSRRNPSKEPGARTRSQLPRAFGRAAAFWQGEAEGWASNPRHSNPCLQWRWR